MWWAAPTYTNQYIWPQSMNTKTGENLFTGLWGTCFSPDQSGLNCFGRSIPTHGLKISTKICDDRTNGQALCKDFFDWWRPCFSKFDVDIVAIQEDYANEQKNPSRRTFMVQEAFLKSTLIWICQISSQSDSVCEGWPLNLAFMDVNYTITNWQPSYFFAHYFWLWGPIRVWPLTNRHKLSSLFNFTFPPVYVGL